MKRITSLLLVVACLSLYGGCWMTIAPKPIVSHQASYEGNIQNSGVLSSDANGFVVTQYFLDRHGFKKTDVGVSPAGSNYRITAQLMDKAVAEDQSRRNKQGL